MAPKEVTPGEEISIFLTIVNEGEETGTASFEVLLDNTPILTKDATLSAGGSSTLFYSYTADLDPGTYTFSSGDYSDTVTVSSVPGRIPWATILVVIIIAGAAVYVAINRGLIQLSRD